MGQNFPVQYVISPPQQVFSGQILNYLGFKTVSIQVDGLANGDSVSFVGSLLRAGGDLYPLLIEMVSQALIGDIVNSITQDGVYQIRGGLYVVPTHTGTASMPTITMTATQN